MTSTCMEGITKPVNNDNRIWTNKKPSTRAKRYSFVSRHSDLQHGTTSTTNADAAAQAFCLSVSSQVGGEGEFTAALPSNNYLLKSWRWWRRGVARGGKDGTPRKVFILSRVCSIVFVRCFAGSFLASHCFTWCFGV